MESKCLVFLVCYDLVPLSQPAPIQCFTPRQPIINRCASTHFGENQLAPSSIGISPLTTAHQPIFQHWSVRTSTWFYPSFILAMVRSPGFGSIRSDERPIKTRFRFGSELYPLNHTTPYKSPAHSSTGTRSHINLCSHCLSDYGFMFYFTPRQGFSFTFPSRYYFAIGHAGVFSLTRWSSQIHTGFHVSHATRDRKILYFCFSTTGLSPSMVQDSAASFK